jgi:endonuclease/exonuclease/phosphatase family metal-dependent hydrolase
MKTTLRRLLVAGVFAFVGALLIDGTVHAQAGCTTPDPFTALGGGTCYNGGWFPPGMPIPRGPGATTPPPAPAAPAACTTPDPFAALGGGTCYKGGWFPPGMAIPRGPGATPQAPAPAAPSACTTPDPFAALGGGTCYKGGWFPPGMAIPGGPGAAAPAPAPAAPSACTTPDPFAALGGGTCYKGGWFPPGMAIPGRSASSPKPAAAAQKPPADAPKPPPAAPSSDPAAPTPAAPAPKPVAPASEPVPASAGGAVGLRVLEWNTHHGVGSDGHYNLDRIATWIAKMDAHVVMLNEVEKNTSWGNEDQPARYEALLEAKTGRKWYHMFTQEFGDSSANGKGHVILSVYPIDAVSRIGITPSSGLKGAGAAGEASITVNGRNISLVISHLDPESKSMRLTQARDVISWAASYAENRIIAGDMNAWPDQSSIAEFAKTYNDSWAVAASRGAAQAVAGISPSGATRSGRIDYIFYSKNAGQLVLKSSRVYDTRDASGHMPSDHRPVVTTFEVR